MFQPMQPVMQPASVSNSAANMSMQQAPQQSAYVKVWKGILSAERCGQPVFITRLEGYRNSSASESLAENWPQSMQIVRLASQDHMNNEQYVGKADFMVFRVMNQHSFLQQMLEKKLCAVIRLPSQILLLSVSNKACRLIGKLFPGDVVSLVPRKSSQQQQLHHCLIQQQQQHNQQMQRQQQHPQLLQLQQLQQQMQELQQQMQQLQQQQQQPPLQHLQQQQPHIHQLPQMQQHLPIQQQQEHLPRIQQPQLSQIQQQSQPQ